MKNAYKKKGRKTGIMIIRKIRPEEIKRTVQLFAASFEESIDISQSSMEMYEESLKNPKTRDDFYCLEKYAAFEDDDRTMMSYFVAKPFPIHFDLNHCTMIGIAGVATLPQYRRRGGIRGCFELALKDMYKNNNDFSYLYPFSTAYYRKFGYELCCETVRYKIKLNYLPDFKVEGTCHLADQENNYKDEIQAIHQIWEKRYNMMIENEDTEYKWLTQTDPYKEKRYTYLYINKEGIPKGYFHFKTECNNESRDMNCFRFVYTDTEGLKGLLNLAKSLSADHQHICFQIPTDQYIAPYLPEMSFGACSREYIFAGMVRVIHVENVLRKAIYIGSDSISITVKDPYIEENNKTFHVTFENNKAVSVDINQDPGDIVLNINDFSRLIVGGMETNQIDFLENVTINTDMEKLSKVFYKKPMMITEYF